MSAPCGIMARMAHPVMFDRSDPIHRRIRAAALAFPGAAEKLSHGRAAFHTVKVFAYASWTRKLSDGTYERHPHALVIHPDPHEREAYLQDGAWLPPYLAASGWIAIDLDHVWLPRLNELLDASYRTTAPKRLIAELDAR